MALFTLSTTTGEQTSTTGHRNGKLLINGHDLNLKWNNPLVRQSHRYRWLINFCSSAPLTHLFLSFSCKYCKSVNPGDTTACWWGLEALWIVSSYGKQQSATDDGNWTAWPEVAQLKKKKKKSAASTTVISLSVGVRLGLVITAQCLQKTASIYMQKLFQQLWAPSLEGEVSFL